MAGGQLEVGSADTGSRSYRCQYRTVQYVTSRLTRDGRVEALRFLHEAVELAQLLNRLLLQANVAIVINVVTIGLANLLNLIAENLEVLGAGDKLKDSVGNRHGAGVDGSKGH